MRLNGKRVIVTGANRSIGKAIALLFAKEGAELVISYRSDKKGAEDVVRNSEGRATALYADFSTLKDVEKFFYETKTILGSIDILINNAAGYNTDHFFDLKPQAFEDLLKITVLTPFYLSQLVAKDMVDQGIKGNIINVSSIAVNTYVPNRLAHSSGKAALNRLTQSMALDLAAYDIRVNAIAPGNTTENSEDNHQIPLGRTGSPSDQAYAALFLATDASLTGQILTVDGGQTLVNR